MQATYSVRRSSSMAFAILFAIVSALVIGGLAGYWLKGLSPQVTAPVSAVSAKAAPAIALPAGQAALSVQHHAGPALGALKAAGDDRAPAVSVSAPVINHSWVQSHRRGGMQDPNY